MKVILIAFVTILFLLIVIWDANWERKRQDLKKEREEVKKVIATDRERKRGA